MKKYINMAYLIFILSILVSGCTVNFEERLANIEKKTEVIDARVGSLETRQDTTEQRQTAVEEYLTKQRTEPAAKAPAMTDEEIQTALTNAGCYTGTIDGKIGPNTDRAIRDFQKANGLEPDGKVGTKTRALLMKYLGVQMPGQ